MNQLSFVRSEVLVGTDADVINPLSFVKSDVFVGNEADVMNQLSFVKSETAVGTLIFIVLSALELAENVSIVVLFF